MPLTLLLAHPALGSFLRPCRLLCLGCLLDSATIKSLFIALYSLSLFIIYLFYLYSSTSGTLGEIFDIFCNSRYIFEMSNLQYSNHGLRTPRDEIAFTARPKIQSQSKSFRYSRSIFKAVLPTLVDQNI